jgi:F-type H+-transporting ATPase subunit epsilon
MLPESIQLVVVTPERQLLRETASDVQLPGAGGYMGVLPRHAPLITELGIGELTYRRAGNSEPNVLAVLRGFAEVLPDRITVLAETAEHAVEIDLARAERAMKRAQERLSSGDPNIDWDRATVALQRALIRIQVARKYRGASFEQH